MPCVRPRLKAFDFKKERAICALSLMTSPNLPVSMIPPLPGIDCWIDQRTQTSAKNASDASGEIRRQMKGTNSNFDRHHGSRTISKVSQSTANSNRARVRVHAVLLVHWRTNVLQQVISTDGDMNARRNGQRRSNTSRRLSILGSSGRSIHFAIVLLDHVLHNGRCRVDGGGRSGRIGRSKHGRDDSSRRFGQFRSFSDILNDLERSLSVYLVDKVEKGGEYNINTESSNEEKQKGISIPFQSVASTFEHPILGSNNESEQRQRHRLAERQRASVQLHPWLGVQDTWTRLQPSPR